MLIRRFAAGTCFVLFFLVTSAVPHAASVTVYRITDLGFPAGSHYMHAWAMNGHGDIAGMFVAADGYGHAFRWTDAIGFEDLGANGGYSSIGFGINDRGDVVGTYWDRNWQYHPFIAHPGEAMTDLRDRYPLVELIYGVSNDGRLTGLDFSNRAFRTQPDGSFQELTANFSFGASINDYGEVTGVTWQSASMTEPRHAFRFSDADGFVDLGALDGDSWSGGRAINQSGAVAGFSLSPDGFSIHGFRATPGLPLQALGSLPGVSPFAINDYGDVVGSAAGLSGWGPFLYTDAGGMIEVRNRISLADQAAYTLGEAWGVNNAGQIMVHYYTSDGAGLGTVRLTSVEYGGPTAYPTVDVPVLTPPDGRLVLVTVDPHIAPDPYDDHPVCQLSRIINSEGPISGVDPDAFIATPISAVLRATRLGSGPGRTYEIVVGCRDRTGAFSETGVTVVVPHDAR